MKGFREKLAVNNMTLKCAALLFAIFLWLYVDVQQNPINESLWEIPIDYINLPENLAVVSDVHTINVTVKGRNEALARLKSADFQATIDLTGISLGSNRLPVKIKAPRNVIVAATSPARVSVTIDELSEKIVPAKANIIGSVLSGYTYYPPTLDDNTVKISGSKTLLDSIVQAEVDVDVSKASSNLVLNLPVKLLTNDGIMVDDDSLVVEPKTIEVFLPVEQEKPSKWVNVKPRYVGSPKRGYEVADISAVPGNVKISGDLAALDQVNDLLTEAIAIDGLDKDLLTKASLRLPEGITVTGGNEVEVRIVIIAQKESKEIEVPISIRHLAEGYGAKMSSDRVKMTVQGVEETLTDDRIRQIKIYADLDGLPAGSHTVELSLENNSGLEIQEVLPPNITVEITDETPSISAPVTDGEEENDINVE